MEEDNETEVVEEDDDEEVEDLESDENDNKKPPIRKPKASNELEDINSATIDRLLAIFSMCKYNVEALRVSTNDNFVAGNIFEQ